MGNQAVYSNSNSKWCRTLSENLARTVCVCVCAGKKDNLCPFTSAVAAAAKAPKGHLLSFDVGHFDPYVQPTLGQSLQKQLDFLKEHAV